MRVLTGVTLIDGTGGDPLPGASIVIGDDGRIDQVGAIEHFPSGAPVTDAGGMSAMPGLVDSHVHFYISAKTMQERAPHAANA